MKKPSPLDYAFAVGRVRALERYLVSQAVFKEAVEEQDFPSAIRTVFDSGRFPDTLVEIRDSEELDAFLKREEESLLTEVKGLFLEKEFLDVLKQMNKPDKSLSLAGRLNCAFVIDYFRHAIDLGNLKILLRLKYAGHSKDKLADHMMSGGFLDGMVLTGAFDLSYSEIGEKLYVSAYRDLWDAAVEMLEERESFVAFERGMEDFLMRYVKQARRIVFGPEPVFAYALAKMREIAHLRILVVGKLNRIPSEILKERLGETYV
ncbi:MAG: V-type ATPase subunit [Candidatus Aminicenantes bacterium]|nr:V-type ATPase subunit [Candidatus Aminicenantes bacterium]